MLKYDGEPFLYPDLLPLITYMKSKGFVVSVVTNGTKVAKLAKELVEVGLDVLLVSVDGPRDTHDNIRGYKGAFRPDYRWHPRRPDVASVRRLRATT